MTLSHFVGQQLLADFEARATAWSDIQGHLPFLRETAGRVNGQMILELGVRTANSTAALLLGAVESGGYLISVDIAQPTYPQWWHETDSWELFVGDDMSEAIRACAPQAVDVLFIDTSHAYEHTLAELRTYGPRVRPGGVILLHDVEVERFPELPGSEPPYPVRLAVERYCADAGLDFTIHRGFHGLAVIEVPA